MRGASVEIETLIKYMKLLEEGKSTAKLRKELLEEQKNKLIKKRQMIDETLVKLDFKIEIYNDIFLRK